MLLIFFSVSCGNVGFWGNQPIASPSNNPKPKVEGEVDSENPNSPNGQDSGDDVEDSPKQDDNENPSDDGRNPDSSDQDDSNKDNDGNNDPGDIATDDPKMPPTDDDDEDQDPDQDQDDPDSGDPSPEWDVFCGDCAGTPAFVGNYFEARHECFAGSVSTVGKTRCQAVNSICSLIYVRRYYLPSDIACVEKGRAFPRPL